MKEERHLQQQLAAEQRRKQAGGAQRALAAKRERDINDAEFARQAVLDQQHGSTQKAKLTTGNAIPEGVRAQKPELPPFTFLRKTSIRGTGRLSDIQTQRQRQESGSFVIQRPGNSSQTEDLEQKPALSRPTTQSKRRKMPSFIASESQQLRGDGWGMGDARRKLVPSKEDDEGRSKEQEKSETKQRHSRQARSSKIKQEKLIEQDVSAAETSDAYVRSSSGQDEINVQDSGRQEEIKEQTNIGMQHEIPLTHDELGTAYWSQAMSGETPQHDVEVQDFETSRENTSDVSGEPGLDSKNTQAVDKSLRAQHQKWAQQRRRVSAAAMPEQEVKSSQETADVQGQSGLAGQHRPPFEHRVDVPIDDLRTQHLEWARKHQSTVSPVRSMERDPTSEHGITSKTELERIVQQIIEQAQHSDTTQFAMAPEEAGQHTPLADKGPVKKTGEEVIFEVSAQGQNQDTSRQPSNSGRAAKEPKRPSQQSAEEEAIETTAPPPKNTAAYRVWLRQELAKLEPIQGSVERESTTIFSAEEPSSQTSTNKTSLEPSSKPPASSPPQRILEKQRPSVVAERGVSAKQVLPEVAFHQSHKSNTSGPEQTRQRSTQDSQSRPQELSSAHGIITPPAAAPKPELQSTTSQLSVATSRAPDKTRRGLRPDPFSGTIPVRSKPTADAWSIPTRHALPFDAERTADIGANHKAQHPGLEVRNDGPTLKFPHPRPGQALQPQSRDQPQEPMLWDQLLPRSPVGPGNTWEGLLSGQIAQQKYESPSSRPSRPPPADLPWGGLPGAQRISAQISQAGFAQTPSASSAGIRHSWDSRTQQTSQADQQGLPTRSEASRHRPLSWDFKDYQESKGTSSAKEEDSAPWPLLRRVEATHPRPLAQQPDQSHEFEEDWVNRRFEEHRRRREVQAVSPVPPAPSFSVNYSPISQQLPLSDRVCGRCGEKGHSARQCTGATCYRCGQKGHMSRDCPSPKTTIRRYQVDSQDVASQPFGGLDESSRLPAGRDRDERSRDMSGHDTNARRNDRRSTISREENSRDDMRAMMLDKEPNPSKDEVDEAEVRRRERRASKWAEAEAVDNAQRSKGGRRGRGEEDDDDEGGAARDEKNARKVMRKQERELEKREAAQRALEQGPTVRLPQFVSVATLAQTLGVRYEQFVKRLERLGYDDIFPGMVLNSEVSGMIAMEYNVDPVFESVEDEAEERDLKALPLPENKDYLPARPPVVTIMGHVDHGKTTILDYLRKSSVAAGEAGGITQHIGAFSVPMASSGKAITFLDTPGHAAFLAMRQRGANVTDIVVLVVAADDSVKPQTLEAIKHAKSAGVPMIVAVNKVDKEEADVQRVKQDLARHDIDIEDYGGETQVVEVSGKTGQGMDNLEEAIVSLSEILDHRAETQGAVEGWVLEATTKKSGRVATVLVRRGTLAPGTIIVAGKTWARVRTLKNEGGQLIDEVGPGMPVEVDGWREQASAGDEVLQAPSEQKANDVVDYRTEMAEREKTAQDTDVINQVRRSEQQRKRAEALASWSTEDPDEPAEEVVKDSSTSGSGQIIVPFIIKADVSGSAEAVASYIEGVTSPLIAPRILTSEVGQVHESDIDRAAAANGYIIAFNLPVDESTKGQAAYAGVEILEHNIIYRAQEAVKALFEDKLPPIISQKVIGEADISAAFDISVGGRKTVKIAGCKVRNGVVNRGSRVRVLRNGAKIYDGTSLTIPFPVL